MKKVLSIVLALVMLCSCFVFSGSAAAKCDCENTPIIYIRGRVNITKKDENGNNIKLFEDGEYISQIVSSCLPSLAKGILTQDWDEYCEKVLEILQPAFADFAPDLDGNIPEATQNQWSWSSSDISASHNAGTKYLYRIDTRKSLLELTDDLNKFVETVRAKTGHDKFIFYGRSMGPALLYSYLYKYQRPKNYSDVESVLLSCASAPTNVAAESLLSGNVKIDGASLNRYMTSFSDSIQDVIGKIDMEVVNTAVETLRTQYGITLTADLVNVLYAQLKDKLIAKIIKSYWGLHPGYLAQVNEHFDEMIAYLFGEEGDDVKYARIIADATEYHNTAGINAKAMLKELDDMGKYVSIVSDYGFQQAPVGKGCELIGDEVVGLREQTFGATVTKVDTVFGDDYVNAKIAEGKGDYISPDRQVDLSTAMFPERTWVVKNSNHNWENCVVALEDAILRSKGATVEELSNFVRFSTLVDYNTLAPAQKINAKDVNWGVESHEDPITAGETFLGKVKKLVLGLVDLIKSFIRGFATGESFGKIKDLLN